MKQMNQTTSNLEYLWVFDANATPPLIKYACSPSNASQGNASTNKLLYKNAGTILTKTTFPSFRREFLASVRACLIPFI